MYNYGELVEAVYSDVKELVDSLKEIKEAGWKNALPIFFEILQLIIARVEFYTELTGEQKREIATGVLNKLINIPAIPEFMEEQLFGIVVDLAVTFFNKYLGKDWAEKVNNGE